MGTGGGRKLVYTPLIFTHLPESGQLGEVSVADSEGFTIELWSISRIRKTSAVHFLH